MPDRTAARIAARAAAVMAVIVAPMAGEAAKPMPLVNADEEMASFVNRARTMIEKQDYAGGIEILQALLNRAEQCFVPLADGHRYVSLAASAAEVVGELPPEALEQYRRQYDAEARELLRRGRENLDERALRDVVRRYFHTRHGDEAMNVLAAVLFDRGKFSQAARCWRDVLVRYRDTDLSPAALLVKTAVAHHFAGERRQAEAALEELRRRHPQASCVLAGEKQNAVAFAERMLALRRPVASGGAVAAGGWTCLAGSPDGMAVMSPCRPVLRPRWTRPKGSIGTNPNVQALLSAMKTPGVTVRRFINGQMVTAPQQGATPGLRDGHVTWTMKLGGSKVYREHLPALMHPVVVQMLVIVRAPDAVVAYDLLTGDRAWDTFSDFPLYRPRSSSNTSQVRRVISMGYGSTGLEDEGRCTLTIGGGKVFAVGYFAPNNVVRYYVPNRQATLEPDTSVLAAFSIKGEGKLLWRTGDADFPEIVRNTKFLSAPTYVNGRLYVLGEQVQTFYLFCLDADTGRMLWSKPAMVSQTPAGPARPYPYVMAGLEDRGSAPAVADGRVFACTNAGVVAAFDADTGQGLWAYQYDSKLNQPGSLSRGIVYRPGQVVKTYPPNPLIVTGGRVLCLPADGERLLALRADTGEPVWEGAADRRSHRHLSAIDEGRLLLSGPGLRVLDTGDGHEIWPRDLPARDVQDIRGRPAVTLDAILASGKGRVVKVWLKDYTSSSLDLRDPEGLLGNLVCVDGKLLAANAAGVSGYFTFEYAYRELTARLAKAAEKDRAGLLYQRAMNAFNDNRASQALPDLQRARKLAQQHRQDTLLERIGQGLYQTHIALANQAASNAVMLAQLRQAETFAYSERSRAEMLLRMAKYHARVGRHAESARLAQELTTKYGDTDMVDVEIGPAASPHVRDRAETPRFSGYRLGQKLIRRLIDAHGQGCYAAFDRKAQAELAAAVAADTPDDMVRVAHDYQHSRHAPLALLRAGESLYRRALKAEKPARLRHLAEAGQHLSRIRRDYGASDVSPSAALGMAMVYEQINPRAVRLGLRGLSDVPGETKVSFAGVSGPLREVLRRFDTKMLRPRPAPQPLPVSLQTPLQKLYAVGGEAMVVRDGDGRPVRLGKARFIITGNRLAMLDPTAGSYEAGRQWEAPLPFDGRRLLAYGMSAYAMVMIGGLSEDGSTFLFGSRAGFYAVSVKTGKIQWRKTAGDSMVSQLNWMGVGDSKLVVLNARGAIDALDARSGKIAFHHDVTQTQLPWRGPPQIAGGVLLAVHGRSDWSATVFDVARQKLLGSIPLGRNQGQARLTADGLVVVLDGSRLRLVEPLLGIQENIWSVGLAAELKPAILDVTDAYVALSPSDQTGLIELRGLAEHGRIVRSFQTRAVGGIAAIPVRARILGDRLYVVAGAAAPNRHYLYAGHMTYTQQPSLQAFDLNTGKLLWAANLTMPGMPSNLYVAPIQVCRTHVGVLVKQSYNRPSHAMLFESRTGRLVQKVEVPGVQRVVRAQISPHVRHGWLSSPALAEGRMLLETHKGLEVYGAKTARNP